MDSDRKTKRGKTKDVREIGGKRYKDSDRKRIKEKEEGKKAVGKR